MRLYIGIITSKQFFRSFNSQVFYYINALAATIIALSRIAFCILVCKRAAHSSHYSLAYPVFGCNQLDAFLLALVARRLHQTDVITVPEFFRVHYGSRELQCVYGVIFMLVYILYLVSQYKGFGTVASAVFDIPYPLAVGMVYLFILYTTLGGYRSVVRTDVFNLILLVLGLAVICGTILSRAGGLSALLTQAGQISGYAHSGMS